LNRSVGFFLALVVSVACGGSPTAPPPPPPPPPPPAPPGPVASVAVSPGQSSVPVGGTVQLSAVGRDAQGTAVPSATFTWQSSATGIATVSSSGKVDGITVGSATISATSNGATGSSQVTVTAVPAGVPQVVLASFIGGGDNDMVRDMAFDAAGNLYVAGATRSNNFPTSGSVLDRTFNGFSDGFVAKISPSGQLLWSTVLGGPNFDRIYAMELDDQGAIYVAGRAGIGFPVTAGAFQTQFGGGQPGQPYEEQDGFVCKLAPEATRIVFCSYFGTGANEPVRDIAIDPQGNIYLAAHVQSTNPYPAAWFTSAFQRTPAGGFDGVIAKIAPDGSRVIWASYLGGSGDEAGEPSIRLSPDGTVNVFYITFSPNMPTPNGFAKTRRGTNDAYVAKFSPDGSNLLFGTYVGGDQAEVSETHNLAIDPQGNLIVAAGTLSPNFPGTSGGFQATYGGTGGGSTGANSNYPGDGFVAKISPTGQLIASTFLGGRFGEAIEGVAVDALGNVYVAGGSFSNNLPFTAGAYRTTIGGNADAFVAKLSPDLKQLLYLSYFGGSGEDFGRAVAVTPGGAFALGGQTQSANYPVFQPFQATRGGSLDGQVARLTP